MLPCFSRCLNKSMNTQVIQTKDLHEIPETDPQINLASGTKNSMQHYIENTGAQDMDFSNEAQIINNNEKDISKKEELPVSEVNNIDSNINKGLFP